MVVKKAGKTIYGAELTSAEKKALDIEIRKELAEYYRKDRIELVSLILWQLHIQLGFGPTRLKRFFDNFDPALDELTERYELTTDEVRWLCTEQLKEYGIDIENWK